MNILAFILFVVAVVLFVVAWYAPPTPRAWGWLGLAAATTGFLVYVVWPGTQIVVR